MDSKTPLWHMSLPFGRRPVSDQTSTQRAVDLPLDSLFRFSGEVRNMIWKHYLFPQPQERGSTNLFRGTLADGNRLALLRTSPEIYKEVVSLIYPPKDQPFLISISPKFRYGSWFTLSSGRTGSKTWVFGSVEEARKRGFEQMGREPAALRIEIEAHDRKDPGQALLLEEKIRNLAKLLLGVQKRPQSIEIELKDTSTNKWFEISTTNVSEDSNESKLWKDHFELILLPLVQLRSIGRASVTGSGVVRVQDQTALEMMGDLMELSIPFGQYEDLEGLNPRWTDKKTKTILLQHGFFEECVATSDGWTATMMRLERFTIYYRNNDGVESDFEKGSKMLMMAGEDGTFEGIDVRSCWTSCDDNLLRDWTYLIGEDHEAASAVADLFRFALPDVQ